MLLFAVAVSIVAPVLFGHGAGARIVGDRRRFPSALKSGSRETRRLRNVLVGAEIALSIVLVVGAVLLIRSMARLQDVDPGFNPEQAVAFTLTLPSARYADAAARFSGVLRNRTPPPRTAWRSGRRGDEHAGVARHRPGRAIRRSKDGRRPISSAELQHASTTRDYFTAMGIRLLAGRFFADTDTRDDAARHNREQTLAHAYFRGLPVEQVIGKRITFGRPQDSAPWNTIVGVVADERQGGLDKPAQPTAYSPHRPAPAESADVRRSDPARSQKP